MCIRDRPIAFSDPTVGKEDLLLLQDYLRFMWAITWLATTNGLGSTRIDTKFEAEYSVANTSFVKYIPVLLDHQFNFTTGGKIDMITDADVLVEFRGIAIGIPKLNVGSFAIERSRDATDRLTVLREDK